MSTLHEDQLYIFDHMSLGSS